MDFIKDFMWRSSTHCIACHVGFNIGAFAAFCKEQSTLDFSVFRLYVQEDMHPSDLADIQAVANEYFPDIQYDIVEGVPYTEMRQMVNFSNLKAVSYRDRAIRISENATRLNTFLSEDCEG